MLFHRVFQFATIAHVFGISAAAVLPQRAVARPLEPEVCKNLTSQRDELEARGVRQLITNGPTAALGARQLADVRQFLDLEGQLRFRCPFDQVLAPLKEDVPEEPENTAATPADDTTAQPAPVKSKDAPKKKAAPAKPASKEAAAKAKPDADATQSSVETKTPPTAAAKKTSPAPRTNAKAVDDAYRPPAEGSPNSSTLDQQARQPK